MLNESDQSKVFVLDTFSVDVSESLIALRAGELAEGRSIGRRDIQSTEMSPNVHLLVSLKVPNGLKPMEDLITPSQLYFLKCKNWHATNFISKDGLVKAANLKCKQKIPLKHYLNKQKK